MSILISSIGGSDPIRSGYDGPILHILRNYTDIDECYFFMSSDIELIHKDPKRNYYQRAFERFCLKTGRVIKFTYISTEILSAHNFNVFYDLYKNKILDIFNNSSCSTYYINVTSGTPQMQITLSLLCQEFDYKNIIPVQVNNFSTDSKEHSYSSLSDKYDFEFELESNVDEEQNSNRCDVAEMLLIKRNNTLEKIRSLININGYSVVIDLYSDFLNEDVKLKSLIYCGKYRTEMNYEKAFNILYTNKIDNKPYLPLYKTDMKMSQSQRNSLFEYYLQLENLVKQNNYNDFVIRLDVFVIELLRILLKNKFKFDIKDYLDRKYFCIEKVKDNELQKFIIQEYLNKNLEFKNGYPNIMLLSMIHQYFDKDSKNNKFFEKILEIHYERNGIAHGLNVISKTEIESIIPITNILNHFKKLLIELYPDIKLDYFNSYSDLNNKILELLR